MSILHRSFVVVFFLALSSAVFAERRAPVLSATASPSLVRYAGFGEVREMRLEIFDQEAQLAYDSVFSRGNLIEYSLTDRGGRRLPDGSYLFIVTIKDFEEAVTERFGTIELAGRRVTLQNGAADSLSPEHVHALQVHRRAASAAPVDRIGIDLPDDLQPVQVVGTPAPADKPSQTIMAIPRADVSGTGTANRVTKWVDTAGTLGNSTITEVDGKVGIGTSTPGGQLHIFGTANLDIFSGMGPDVQLGPAMNYGYSGATFGRGSGFFNVRPDGAAVAPNPSLRFMTINQQRMIITNAGNVGIGTFNPSQKLEVFGNLKLSGTGALMFADSTSMSTAGATLGPNTFIGTQTVNGAVTATGAVTGSEYFIAGSGRVLRADGVSNLMVGLSTGIPSGGGSNTLVGTLAGLLMVGGNSNAFFGTGAGLKNTGSSNTFVGAFSGAENTASNNTFIGKSSGGDNTTGTQNTFVGIDAGGANTIENGSTIVGYGAGNSQTGGSNSFFGHYAGAGSGSADGTSNAFFGVDAGKLNSGGSTNSFFGGLAGQFNTNGASNVFIGFNAGGNNDSGTSNTAVGSDAGDSTTSGSSNTFLGALARSNPGTLINATAIGANAQVTQANSLVLGSINGINGATSDTIVGIGTTAPAARLHVAGGDIGISSQGSGLILRATTGLLCYRLTVNSSGATGTALVACP